MIEVALCALLIVLLLAHMAIVGTCRYRAKPIPSGASALLSGSMGIVLMLFLADADYVVLVSATLAFVFHATLLGFFTLLCALFDESDSQAESRTDESPS